VPRRWVYTLGASALIAAAALFAQDGTAGLLAGLIVRVLGVACLNVTLNLYIMDTIPRGDLVRSEPLRLAVSGGAWTLCPSLGVFLYGRFGAIAADGLSAAAAALLLATFWAIRLSDNPAIAAPRLPPPPNPLRNIRRFIAQPRLRLGWLIAFGRSSWWSQFFTFAPLYMVISGHSELASALLISLGNATLFLNVLVGRLAERVGVRRVIVGAFLLTGATMLLAALIAPTGWSYVVAGLLLLASFWVSAFDAVGNIPFLRAVRARERPHMTTVFRTYIDLSDLLPSAVFALLLTFLRPGERVRDRGALDVRDRPGGAPSATSPLSRSIRWAFERRRRQVERGGAQDRFRTDGRTTRAMISCTRPGNPVRGVAVCPNRCP
jgi:hypothetical protein